MKELMNMYGDIIVSKNTTSEFPCRIGEENVLLGINNAFSYITRTFVPVITIDQSEYYKYMMDAGLTIINQMKLRCSQKLKGPTANFNARLKGEVIKSDMGYHDRGLKIIKEQDQYVRDMGEADLIPLEKKIHAMTSFSRIIIENKIFPKASVPARRVLKKQVEQVAENTE